MRFKSRGQRRHKGQGRQRRMLGFLQPCLLVQLYEQDSHGYDLLQGLGEFVKNAEEYDPSVIYRVMRDMESEGWVDSYEGTVSRGPKRRVYRLNPEGKKRMERWISDLQKARDEIDNLLAVYSRQKK